VARSANENHPMILNKTDGRQRFASSSGRNIQNQIRSGISTGVRVSKETEQPFLMIVEGNVAILENVFVLLDELVGISNNVRQDRFGIHRGYANINKVQHMFVDIFHCYVAQLDERVQVKGVVTVFFHVKKRQHFFDEAEEDELDDVLVDVGADVFDADRVCGFQLFDVDIFDRLVKVFDGFGDRKRRNLGDMGSEKFGIKKCLDDFGLFDFDAGEQRFVVVVLDVHIGVAVDDEFEDAFFVVRDGDFDGFPFGFGEFGLVGDVHFFK
jgi:hypothetical protein